MNDRHIYELINDYARNLELRIAELEKLSIPATSEQLRICKRNGSFEYYSRFGRPDRKQAYIPRSDKRHMKILAEKKYISEAVKALKLNLRAVKQFLQIHSGKGENDLAERLPDELQRMIAGVFTSGRIMAQEWEESNYDRNPYHSEGLIHVSQKGDLLRSKSEVFIADGLYHHNLPYRPEMALKLRNRTVYPDFSIMKPDTREIIYWEHFGKMSDPDYADGACRKIRDYTECGIIPGKNLICTFEAAFVPLTNVIVENVISCFFPDR